ncbi:MAG: hypothetical protein DWI57_06775 [Chloroflexi bacterium]|nr:MAG: hypothetical protein DWI57_06775 [Chloroflexota bacterium]
MKYWPTFFIYTNRRRCGLVVCSILLLALAAALNSGTIVYAGEGDPPGAEPCASCHSQETDAWLVSPHAVEAGDVMGTTGAACTTCHGDYSRGHPDDGAMESLTVDSAMCQECHEATFDQWEHSIHADEGVQCIGCHQVHSQELRLTDEQLCRSCHKEAVGDPFHTAHWYGEVACTNCHMAAIDVPDGNRLVSHNGLPASATLPSHDFVTVSSQNCLTCHKVGVGPEAVRNDPTLTELHAVTANAEMLGNKLSAAQKVSKSLERLTPMTLGFGIGIGGILGIIFMLFVAQYGRKVGQL